MGGCDGYRKLRAGFSPGLTYTSSFESYRRRGKGYILSLILCSGKTRLNCILRYFFGPWIRTVPNHLGNIFTRELCGS